MAATSKIGLITGNSQFPLILAEAARKNGYRVIALAHVGETDQRLEELVDEILWVKVGQLQKMIDFFKDRSVTDAVMAGGLTKENMFVNFEPDERALLVAARVTNLSDDGILRAMASEFEADGITIRPSTIYTPELLAADGVLTRRAPDDAETADIEFGWHIAKELGRLDVGQCVVVRDRVALALEGIDGSDETIKRGGRLAQEKAVVVKVCKPTQDLRFDLPSVGLGTIEVMKKVRASVLAIEAGKTLIFDKEAMISAADEAKIAIIARG